MSDQEAIPPEERLTDPWQPCGRAPGRVAGCGAEWAGKTQLGETDRTIAERFRRSVVGKIKHTGAANDRASWPSSGTLEQ
jgi:hypothetical protein